MDTETARVEHLKLVQGIVNRIGRNSFAIKSAAATAVAVLVAFTASTDSPVAALAGLAVLPLWLLDARFLKQERDFRRVYDNIRRGPPRSSVLTTTSLWTSARKMNGAKACGE